ncbi:MAG: Cardiolipin synthase [Anaerolineales bacterium]|nr:Cardiolipin synthase [Anaerolineales bacterium]
MRNKSRLRILSLFALFIASCFGVDRASTPVAEAGTETTGDGTQLAPIELPAGYGADGGWIQIYFTNPQSPLASQKTGGIDGPLADAIDSAKLSVDVAIYSLSLNSVRDALLRAHDRGARVRLVMESDNLDRSDPQKLKDAGIPVLGDRREGLMHNKFTIIDGSEVWVGGMNYTDSGAYEDNNVLIRIRSVKMAENYTKEFEEMFVEDRFGDNVLAETPNPRVTIDGTPVDTYFSPDDGAQAILYDILNEARESIYFMAFSFTADPLGEAIRARAAEGVTVAGVMDEEQVKSNQGTEFDPFRQAGLDVYMDGNAGQMHHKIIVVDESVVVVGSYNFTNSAESRNDENLMAIYNDSIAAFFIEEFKRVYGAAK